MLANPIDCFFRASNHDQQRRAHDELQPLAETTDSVGYLNDVIGQTQNQYALGRFSSIKVIIKLIKNLKHWFFQSNIDV